MDSAGANAALNDRLAATGPLLSPDHYRRHIPCTPVEPIQDTCLAYSPDLQVLFCTSPGCGRILHSDTWLRHLKRQHRTALGRLDKTAVARIHDTIGRLPFRTAEQLAPVRHDAYYFAHLPLALDNFKCRECGFVEVNRKNVRKHVLSEHPPSAKSINQKVDHVLERIPLQVSEGFPNNRKIHFIPKLPAIAPPPSPRPYVPAASDPHPHPCDPVPEHARTAILEAHQRSIAEKAREQPYSDVASQNQKLLNSFLTNSNILTFLRDKDRAVLVDLVDDPRTSRLELDKGLDLVTLEGNVLAFMLEVHEHIPNLPRRLRQLLKTEDASKPRKEMKDFVRLDAPASHFRRYCRLVVFLVRVHLIRGRYGHEASDESKSRYFDTTAHIALSAATTASIQRLLGLGVRPLATDVDRQHGHAFAGAVTDLFHALLQDAIPLRVRENPTFQNPVINFYFSSILDPRTHDVVDSALASKLASVFIYNTRLLFVAYHYHREDGREDGRPRYEKEVRKYLTNNSQNYFEELTQIRAYGLALSKQGKSTVYTIKESPRGTVEYNGMPYPIQEIKNLFARLTVALETHLTQKLLFIPHLDHLGIEFNRIADTPLLNKTGQSILDTPQLERFRTWFLQELLTAGSGLHRALVRDIVDGRIRFKRSAVQRLVADHHSFTELLGVDINLLSGGPLRGSELALLLFKNTRVKLKSLTYDKETGMFFVTTDYHKSQKITQRDRPTYRYLVPKLSRIIVAYIAAFTPLRDYLYQHHYGDGAFDNPYLLARNRGAVSSYSMSIRLQRETAGSFRKGLSLQAWRKVINFLIKTKMHTAPPDRDSSDSSDSDDLVEDKQANRSTRVSFNHYFNAEHLAHCTATPKELNALRDFSIRYFDFFHLLDDSPSPAAAVDPIAVPSLAAPTQMVTLDNKGLLQRLRRLYGDPRADFLNPEQRVCIDQVLAGRPFVTYINRTGSGKSLVYLLPAFIQRDRLFVVFTPRLALKEDLYRRAGELGLQPSRFEDAATYHGNLMFCSVEDLDAQELKMFIERHRGLGRDVTVLLDEAHLFLLERTFRLDLRDVASVVQYRANVVLISATLPRPLLQLLNRTFGIGQFNSVIRGSSNRSDISYRRVYFRAREDRDEAVCGTIRAIDREDGDVANKIVVFVTSKKQGEELAERLHTDVVYSGKDDLARILEEFIHSKTQRTLVTTSILEAGVDIRQIKYTISVEPIYSLISVIQSSGRIRQRGVSYVVCQQPTKFARHEILRHGGGPREVKDIGEFAETDRAWYRRWTIEEACLRTPISQFLDDAPYRCRPHMDDLCSVCVENEAAKAQVQWGEEAMMRERRARWLELEERLLQLKEMHCLYCLLDPYNSSTGSHHALSECQRIGKDAKASPLRGQVTHELRVQQLPRAGSGCFRCLMPKNICGKQQDNHRLGEGECLMGSFLIDAMAVLFHFRDVVDGLIPGVPGPIGPLSGFVNKLTAPCGVFTLQTMRLVEMLGQLDVARLIEELDEEEEEGEEMEKADAERMPERARNGSRTAGSDANAFRARPILMAIENQALHPGRSGQKREADLSSRSALQPEKRPRR